MRQSDTVSRCNAKNGLNAQNWFFHRVFFFVDYKSELRIDKNYEINPWAPIYSFLALSRGLIRSLSNSTRIENTSSLTKMTKKWQYLWPFSQNCHLKSQKLPKFQNLRKIQRCRWQIIFISCGNFCRKNRIWPRNWYKFCNLTPERHFVHFLQFFHFRPN